MTDTTAANHEVESWTEQQMRSDFMHHYRCSSRDLEDYDPADRVGSMEYASRWLDRNDEWAEHWMYLTDATNRWHEDPAEAERLLAASELQPIDRRSEEQARYVARNGILTDSSGLPTSHYVTRVYDRLYGASPLADYQPCNALASALANSERDGAER
ncbi:hypothetical protein [Nocardia xishanensis]|uniref:hypothetical protein n=1 Tax=Nocardia xishanensis TaxID=238964 RepID=UPI0012F4BB3F|nr:hypothetical protein [Nocardia xishanensis]